MPIRYWSSYVCSSDLDTPSSPRVIATSSRPKWRGIRRKLRSPSCERVAAISAASCAIHASSLLVSSTRSATGAAFAASATVAAACAADWPKITVIDAPPDSAGLDRKSLGSGKGGSVRVDLGGRRILKKKNKQM